MRKVKKRRSKTKLPLGFRKVGKPGDAFVITGGPPRFGKFGEPMDMMPVKDLPPLSAEDRALLIETGFLSKWDRDHT